MNILQILILNLQALYLDTVPNVNTWFERNWLKFLPANESAKYMSSPAIAILVFEDVGGEKGEGGYPKK